MPPVHPGEIPLEEFLKPLAVSQYRLAKALDVPARRINEIVQAQRRITAGTPRSVSPRYFRTSAVLDELASPHDLEVEETGWTPRSMTSARSAP